ncbi:MAG TPA: hypothetical protein PLU31_07570 [Treponemataceae bacterium]|jgi:hypothetical protein|nr:hypothetical protein [Treponemataceae bacterium]
MFSTYKVNADELTEAFVRGIKETYQGKVIKIIIQETIDETQHLLQNKANEEHLDRSIASLEAGNGVEVIPETLELCK